jgi:uncharacterized protein (DUF58 family)
MLPSLRLILLTAAAAPVFLAGAFSPVLTVIGAVYVLILAGCMVADALLLPRKRQIVLQRLLPQRLSLGAQTPVRFEVHNATGRTVEIRLTEDLPGEFQARPEQCVGTFEPDARGTLEYRLLARRRGRYPLGRVDVRVLPVMGLFYRQFRLNLPAEVQVFPNLVDLRRYDLLVRRGLTREQGLARLRQIGEGSEFESLRPHATGDPMGRVDWKATARRARLIVRNYQPERQQSVLVAIDLGRATAGEFEGISRLDYLVNAALMLAYVALRQNDLFSLVAFSDRVESYLPPVRGLNNIDRVARALYELQPRLVEADYARACHFLGLKNRKRSLICLMTDVIDRQASEVIIAYLGRFARYHLPLAVTLADPHLRALGEGALTPDTDVYAKAVALDTLAAREQALGDMRRYGVLVLDVEPRHLTVELINRYLLIKSTRRL